MPEQVEFDTLVIFLPSLNASWGPSRGRTTPSHEVALKATHLLASPAKMVSTPPRLARKRLEHTVLGYRLLVDTPSPVPLWPTIGEL